MQKKTDVLEVQLLQLINAQSIDGIWKQILDHIEFSKRQQSQRRDLKSKRLQKFFTESDMFESSYRTQRSHEPQQKIQIQSPHTKRNREMVRSQNVFDHIDKGGPEMSQFYYNSKSSKTLSEEKSGFFKDNSHKSQPPRFKVSIIDQGQDENSQNCGFVAWLQKFF